MSSTGYVIQINTERLEKPEKRTASRVFKRDFMDRRVFGTVQPHALARTSRVVQMLCTVAQIFQSSDDHLNCNIVLLL